MRILKDVIEIIRLLGLAIILFIMDIFNFND
jgi:hypothetical protein